MGPDPIISHNRSTKLTITLAEVQFLYVYLLSSKSVGGFKELYLLFFLVKALFVLFLGLLSKLLRRSLKFGFGLEFGFGFEFGFGSGLGFGFRFEFGLALNALNLCKIYAQA